MAIRQVAEPLASVQLRLVGSGHLRTTLTICPPAVNRSGSQELPFVSVSAAVGRQCGSAAVRREWRM
jgi:hypothetical protein